MSDDPDIAVVLARAEMRWMSVEDAEITVRARSLAELGRARAAAEARVTELEAEVARLREALQEIARKKCLNGSGTCDWPCVVCIARRALAAEETTT